MSIADQLSAPTRALIAEAASASAAGNGTRSTDLIETAYTQGTPGDRALLEGVAAVTLAAKPSANR